VVSERGCMVALDGTAPPPGAPSGAQPDLGAEP
jgi:hypothetical protein